jgi:HPr kinase/phosphorylase
MLIDMPSLEVKQLLKEKGAHLKLELIAGSNGLDRKITVSDISRPGLAFTGYFGHFPYERTQVIGKSEFTYFNSLPYQTQTSILDKIFSHKDATCCILTRKLGPTQAMTDVFSNLQIPLLSTELSSSALIGELTYFLDGKLAPSIKLHGVLASVYGLGVFITGASGIGKSECALELVKRGHSLIADDVVDIKKRSGRFLVGKALDMSKNLIEARGIGIIDVKSIFGIGFILDEARVELVIKLESWDKVNKIDRTGINDAFAEILGVNVPEITIPVGPGRNLAILVETASLNQRLKNGGFSAAKDFDEKDKLAIDENT